MDCFGTYFTHAQSCDVTRVRSATEWTASVHASHMPNVTRVQSATEWTASVHTSRMPKPVFYIVFKVLYGLGCFGRCFTHVQSCDVTRVRSATEWTASVHASHMPNVTRVQSATEWTASVHTSRMPKPVFYIVFKVLYGLGCFCRCFTHVQSCDVTRVQSATEWTASDSVDTSHMSKAVM